MQRRVLFRFRLFRLGAAIPALVVLLLACSDDSGPKPTEDLDRSFYGELITPRYSFDADPVLDDAYLHLKADGNGVAHFPVSWSEISPGDDPVDRYWPPLDTHVRQAREKDVVLSMVVQIVHGDSVDVPEWIDFTSFGDPELRAHLTQFLSDARDRSYGRLGWIWLGEGFDRYLAGHPEEEESVNAFLSAMADSIHRVLPDVQVGTAFSSASLEKSGMGEWARSIRGSIDLVGLSIFPHATGATVPAPEAAFDYFARTAAQWSDGPFAILDSGYPSSKELGSSEEAQAEYAAQMAAWLVVERPSTLALFNWSPLHDPLPELAASIGMARYPDDADLREEFVRIIASSSLRRIDGSRKLGRDPFIQDRP